MKIEAFCFNPHPRILSVIDFGERGRGLEREQAREGGREREK